MAPAGDRDGAEKMAELEKADQHQAEEAPDPDEDDLDDLDGTRF